MLQKLDVLSNPPRTKDNNNFKKKIRTKITYKVSGENRALEFLMLLDELDPKLMLRMDLFADNSKLRFGWFLKES